jgi:glycerol-3-phosphate dehydrogenase
LSKYKLDVVVFEMGSDVASGASKANSGVIHSGINSPPSSLKARFCVEGNKMFQSLADELGFLLQWLGKYVIAKNEEEIEELERLKKVGIKNNVPDLEIKDGGHVKTKVKTPVKSGQEILNNVANTDINIIATKTVKKL